MLFCLQTNHSHSMYNQAYMLYKGEGVDKDEDGAYAIFEKLNSDHAPSIFSIGIILFQKDKSRSRSRSYFEHCLSIEAYKESECYRYLGLINVHENRLNDALSDLIEACGRGFIETEYILGELYLSKGDIVNSNRYFDLASANGNEWAQWRLGKHTPSPGLVQGLAKEANNGIHFYMKIYAEYLESLNDVDCYLSAAEYYRLSKMNDEADICLDNALDLIQRTCTTPSARDKYYEQLISFDHLPTREIYCQTMFIGGTFDMKLETHLAICKEQGSVIGMYYLGRLYYNWGRKTEANKIFQLFLDSNDKGDLGSPSVIQDVKIWMRDDDDVKSESSCDDFVKVDSDVINKKERKGKKEKKVKKKEPEPEEEGEERMKGSLTPVPKEMVYTPEMVSDGIRQLLKEKRVQMSYYDHIISLLKKIGTDEDIIDVWAIEGAKKGSPTCLKRFGKRWLEDYADMEEVD